MPAGFISFFGSPEACRSRRSRRGFTLVEVLFGIGLLAVTAMVFAAAYPVSARLQASARLRAQAVRIAGRQMEALRRLPADTLTSLDKLKTSGVIEATATTQPYPFTNLTIDGGDAVAQLLPAGTGAVTIEDVTLADPNVLAAAPTKLRRLTVTVAWNDRGRTLSVVTRSLVSELEGVP